MEQNDHTLPDHLKEISRKKRKTNNDKREDGTNSERHTMRDRQTDIQADRERERESKRYRDISREWERLIQR